MRSVSPQVDPASVSTAFHLEGKSFSLPSLSHYTVVAFLLQNNEAVCSQTHTHTTPLFPWESFPPFLFALLTSLILCIVPTSLRALQKVCSLPFNQLQLVYFTPYRWHCRVSGDAMAASAFPWLEIVLFQDSVANHCRSFVLSAAGTRHTQENNYFTSLPPPSPPACLPSLTISITSLLATSSFPPCDSSP